ncbi:MAG TPA: AI-2E family transporter, partial [Ktedonobacterales bacterium]|nr:AI-2E family transporter [Ktedonobacterales bacterium]
FVAAVHRYTRAPRALVVVVMALLALATLGLLITLLVRLVADQGQGFVTHLPGYLQTAVDNINTLIAPTTVQIPKDAVPGLNGKGIPADFNVGEILSFAATFATSTGQGLLDFLLTFVSTIYLLLDGHHLANGLQRFFPLEHRQRLGQVMRKIRRAWGSYIRAQLFLAALMTVASGLLLELLNLFFGIHMPFIPAIAIAIGLLETIPVIGPLVALSLATIVGLATNGIGGALVVLGALYVLRLLEDNVVVPQVLGHAIHLPAIVTLFAVAVGSIVAGLLGLILAVPVAAAIKIVIDEYYPHPHPALAGEAAGGGEKTHHKHAKKHTDDLAPVTTPVAAPATAPPILPEGEAPAPSDS